MPSLQHGSHPDTGAALSLRGIVKRFGELPVLNGLALDIAPGSFVAVIGRSGCGKSTLLRLIAGLEQPDQGEIRIDDKRHKRRNDDVRVMFQDARLLPWRRVIDNVRLGLPAGTAPLADEVLRQVGLAQRARDWPRVLSGGQKQRVALARALVHEPRLLLLDEPLGALDALTRIEMHRLIERLWLEHGFTAVLVTHDVAEAVALADRVVLLEDGVPAMDLEIDLPRPRRRDAAFARLEQHILGRLLGAGDPTALPAPAAALPRLRRSA